MIYSRDWKNYEEVCELLKLSIHEVNDLVKQGVLKIKVSAQTGLISITPESVEIYLNNQEQQQG